MIFARYRLDQLKLMDTQFQSWAIWRGRHNCDLRRLLWFVSRILSTLSWDNV